MRPNSYTKEQLSFLANGYRKMKAEDLASAFNRKFGQKRTVAAIRTILHRRGFKCGRDYGERLITPRRLFLDEHLEFMRENYPKCGLSELTSRLNEAFKSDFSERQVDCALTNHRITSGRTGYFRKGAKPWNSGKKGYCAAGSEKGHFSKGNVPANVKPLWSERIGKGGYVEMKVPERNPYTGFKTRYKNKHQFIWEQANGRKVPRGHAVIFLDGDIHNFDPANLGLVSRAELLALNHHDYKRQPEELKPSVMALAKLETKAGIRTRPARTGKRKKELK